MSDNISYRFYATLLDSFTNYLEAEQIWDKYWGRMDNPPHTPDQFVEIQRQSLIDRINRVPFDSEPADRGTAFNEVIDCIIEHRKSDKVHVDKVCLDTRRPGIVTHLQAHYNNRSFLFDLALCRQVADMFKGALTQVFTEATLDTAFGDVQLYGYLDELMPMSIHDIKTTGSYEVGKFKNHWQHIVYPYCQIANGCDVRDFEYNVVEWGRPRTDGTSAWSIRKECYTYVPERDIPRLRQHTEQLIAFLECNRDLITDTKIFNLPSVTA